MTVYVYHPMRMHITVYCGKLTIALGLELFVFKIQTKVAKRKHVADIQSPPKFWMRQVDAILLWGEIESTYIAFEINGSTQW